MKYAVHLFYRLLAYRQFRFMCFAARATSYGSGCSRLCPQVLSSPKFAPVFGFARAGGDTGGICRGPLGIARRQLPPRMAGEGELRRRLRSDLRVGRASLLSSCQHASVTLA